MGEVERRGHVDRVLPGKFEKGRSSLHRIKKLISRITAHLVAAVDPGAAA